MTYEEAIEYWYAHVNFEQKTAVPADFKLDRMNALLASLDDPHRGLRIVHIAGSKGKGSCSAMLAEIFRRAGYRTGLFTSPHLCRVEERFLVDGLPINKQELTQAIDDIRHAIENKLALLGSGRNPANKPPTFFEIATAIGFLHFVRRRVDFAVLEVGLGGRLDSTNVCCPAAAVITSISFDHTAILGDRLASIAREKAGIVKPGRPVVSGVTVPEARSVIESVCREKKAQLHQLGIDFTYKYQPGRARVHDLVRPTLEVTTRRRRWPVFELNLLGEHQGANAALVIACIEELQSQGLHLADQAVAEGLREVNWPARMEIAGGKPLIVLDCAHNVASAVALVDTLQSSFPPGRRLLIFAGSGDKDISGMFRVMSPQFEKAFFTQYTTNKRAVPARELAALWQKAKTPSATNSPEVFATPTLALQAARAQAGPDDLICITGSVFLAGELRPQLAAGLAVGRK
jgi:dihydrofolate synthase/folylpolyglutamate synthase